MRMRNADLPDTRRSLDPLTRKHINYHFQHQHRAAFFLPKGHRHESNHSFPETLHSGLLYKRTAARPIAPPITPPTTSIFPEPLFTEAVVLAAVVVAVAVEDVAAADEVEETAGTLVAWRVPQVTQA